MSKARLKKPWPKDVKQLSAKGGHPRFRKDACAAVRASCEKDKANLRQAAAIVAQVLVHFGAGCGAERERANPGGTNDTQVFSSPTDLASFHDLLLTSTLNNMSTINWDTDHVGRDAVCMAAYHHGQLARQTTSAPLTFAVILSTLRIIQGLECPVGAGGGKVCNF